MLPGHGYLIAYRNKFSTLKIHKTSWWPFFLYQFTSPYNNSWEMADLRYILETINPQLSLTQIKKWYLMCSDSLYDTEINRFKNILPFVWQFCVCPTDNKHALKFLSEDVKYSSHDILRLTKNNVQNTKTTGESG
jgi:hypothetical protein